MSAKITQNNPTEHNTSTSVEINFPCFIVDVEYYHKNHDLRYYHQIVKANIELSSTGVVTDLTLGNLPTDFNTEQNAAILINHDLKVKTAWGAMHDQLITLKLLKYAIDEKTFVNISSNFNKPIYEPLAIQIKAIQEKYSTHLNIGEKLITKKDSADKTKIHFTAIRSNNTDPYSCCVYNVCEPYDISALEQIMNFKNYDKLLTIGSNGDQVYEDIINKENERRKQDNTQLIEHQCCCDFIFRQLSSLTQAAQNELEEADQLLEDRKASQEQINKFTPQKRMSLSFEYILLVNALLALRGMFTYANTVILVNQAIQNNTMSLEKGNKTIKTTLNTNAVPLKNQILYTFKQLDENKETLSSKTKKLVQYFVSRNEQFFTFLKYPEANLDNTSIKQAFNSIVSFNKKSGSTTSLETFKSVANVQTIYSFFTHVNDQQYPINALIKVSQQLHFAVFEHALKQEAQAVYQQTKSLDSLSEHLKHCSINDHIHSFDYASFFVNYLSDQKLELSPDVIEAMHQAVQNWQTNLGKK